MCEKRAFAVLKQTTRIEGNNEKKKKMNESVEQTGLEVNIILISRSQFQEIFEFNQSTHKLKGSMELFDLSVARRKTEGPSFFSLLPTLEGIQSTSNKEVNYIADGKGEGVGLGTNKNYHCIIIDIAFENPVPSVFAFAVKTIFFGCFFFYFGGVGF